MNLLRLFAAIPLALLPALGMAQAYPSKPVRIIAPFPAGSGPDANARELAAELTKHLGVTVIIDNKPGASGIIGTDAAARSAPDGYTLVIGSTTTLSTVPHLYSKLPFNPEKDLIPVSLLGLLNTGLVANPQVQARNAAEVVALLKKQPLSLNAGTSGIGSYSHLSGLWFSHATGGQLSFIPYARSSPYGDLMAGQIQFMFDGLPAAAGNIASGKLKLLGITGNQRHPTLPDTPTFAELGIKDFRPIAWQGLMAPAGTPRPIIDRLAAAMKKIPEKPRPDDGTLLDDHLGRHFAVIGRSDVLSAASDATTERWKRSGAIVIHEPAPALTAWLETHRAGAVVLRPDRYIVGVARVAPDLDRISRYLPA